MSQLRNCGNCCIIMRRIRDLYATFSKTEKRYLKAFLEAFHTRGENQSLSLINLIEKDPDISAEAASEKIYGDTKSKAFIMMKSRLYEKMLDVLMVSSNIPNLRESWHSDMEIARLDLKKQEIQAILLNARGLKDQLEETVNRSEKTATEYDLPLEQMEALRWIMQIYSQKHSTKVAEAKEAIDKAIEVFKGDLTGRHYMDEFRTRFGGSSQTDVTQKYLEETMPILEEVAEKSGSPVSRYYLLLFRIQYYNFKRDYEKCRGAIDDLLEMNAKHKRFNTDQSYGQSYMHLAMLEMYHHHLDSAEEAIGKALSYFTLGNKNHALMLVVLVFIHIHRKKLMDAKFVIQEIRDDPFIKEYSFNWAMSYYFEACVAFIEKDFEKAWKVLNHVTGLEFDKGGWMNGVRIFEIMTLIEMGDMDLAATKLEALRKHQKKYEPDERTQIIFRILNSMQKTMFDFTPSQTEEEQLQMLSDHEWKIAGHEIIRFDEWYRFHSQKGERDWESSYVVVRS